MIENVQMRTSKLVDGLANLNYKDRLHKLGLPTLAYRRRRGEMIELYKHFHIYDKMNLSQSFQPNIRNSRRHKFQLIWHRPKDGTYGIQSNSFYFRATRIWNELPNEVVNAPNINTFKNRLDKAWENETIKYNHVIRSSDS